MKMKEKIRDLIIKSLAILEGQKKIAKSYFDLVLVEQPKNISYGDYTTNIAMVIAKKIDGNPKEIADFLKKAMEEAIKKEKDDYGYIKKIEVIDPGFINFFLEEGFLLKELDKIIKKGDKYGQSNKGKGKTVIVDYSSVNIAKPFSVSHLRSTVIGQAIYNLYKFLGYKTIGDNHLGDWGTQFGKLICAIKKWGDEKEIEKDPIKKLFLLYVKFHQEAKNNSQLEEEGRAWFKKLEGGDKEALRLWKKCVRWSLKDFERIYKILGIKIDYAFGESFYRKMAENIIKESLDKKIAKKSEGALIISFPNDALPPLLIQKSDGTTLYSTRDLATIKYRRKKFKPWKIIYEVGSDQTLYFKQLFWAAELLGFGKRSDYIHVAHGMMRLPSGKMSTRQGGIILLEILLEQAFQKAEEIIKEKNPEIKGDERKKISQIIGLGAIKYNNLSRKPLTEVIFSWEEALNLNGNSGPYLQYVYVRAKSIIRQAKIKISDIKKEEKADLSKGELNLLRQLTIFPEIIEEAAEKYSPNVVATYLFNLAKTFNSFYEKFPILKEKDKKKKSNRLLLVMATAQIIKNGLAILGIDVVEKM